MAAPEVEVPVDGAMAGALGDQRSDAQRTAERALPFSGLIDSIQLLGLGRLEVARELCAAHGLAPIPFDATHALVQLSFMQWNASPVGAYCASFVGVIVDPEMTTAPTRSPPAHRPNDRGLASRPRSSAVLSAFLAAPRALYVPVYTVGDPPHGPRGGGAASRRFGRESLDVFKTEGRFVVSESRGMRHIQIFEERARSIGADGSAKGAGGAVHAPTGYTISAAGAPAERAGSRSMAMLPPSLLPAFPRLALELGRAVRRGSAQAGAMLVPSLRRPDQTVCIATQFTTRPRIADLRTDGRAALAPLVLARPAPDGAYGRVLERLDFAPYVSLCDPTMRGTILGPVPRIGDALR